MDTGKHHKKFPVVPFRSKAVSHIGERVPDTGNEILKHAGGKAFNQFLNLRPAFFRCRALKGRNVYRNEKAQKLVAHNLLPDFVLPFQSLRGRKV